MVNNEALNAAIVDLKNQKIPTYNATIKKYNIDKTTLHQQFKNEQIFFGIKQFTTQKHFLP